MLHLCLNGWPHIFKHASLFYVSSKVKHLLHIHPEKTSHGHICFNQVTFLFNSSGYKASLSNLSSCDNLSSPVFELLPLHLTIHKQGGGHCTKYKAKCSWNSTGWQQLWRELTDDVSVQVRSLFQPDYSALKCSFTDVSWPAEFPQHFDFAQDFGTMVLQ